MSDQSNRQKENIPYGESARKPSRHRKRRRNRRLLLVIGLLLALAAALWVLFSLFGGVTMNSNGVSRASTTTTTRITSGPSQGSASAVTTASQGQGTTVRTSADLPATTTRPAPGTGSKTYIQPSGAAWNLILVNDYNAVPAGYEQNTTMSSVSGGQMDQRAAESYRKMLADGAAYDIRGVSLFRPQSLQESLFNREVNKWKGQGYGQKEAEQKANTIVKRPGYSEHNTGLAADVGGSGNYSLNQNFENTDAYRWLIAHCADYGFILRFPKDKEEITGVIFEPWHYRYVGTEAAKEIMSRGLCLEEYLYEKGL